MILCNTLQQEKKRDSRCAGMAQSYLFGFVSYLNIGMITSAVSFSSHMYKQGLSLMITFLLLILCGCNGIENNSVFSAPERTKQELIADGFRKHILRDATGEEIFKDAWYLKNIDDTTVTYFFKPDYLESVSIDFKTSMNNFDTIAKHFVAKGFIVAKPRNPKAKLALIEPNSKYLYDVYLLERKRLVTFEHLFREVPDVDIPVPDTTEVLRPVRN